MTSETPQFVTSPLCCELVGSMMHTRHEALAAKPLAREGGGGVGGGGGRTETS